MQHLFLFSIFRFIKYTNSDSCGADSDMAKLWASVMLDRHMGLFLRALLPRQGPLQIRQLKAVCSGQNL